MNNIRQLNEWKKRYNSQFPRLTWQYILFGHNEHEVEQARAMAAELDMRFYLKLNWDDLYDLPYSPVQDKELARSFFGGMASRAEVQEQEPQRYAAQLCRQMWTLPQINFDGEVYGCCVNHWESFGNAFTGDLQEILNGERMQHARRMVTGKAEPRSDVPCSTCKIYELMKERGTWIPVRERAQAAPAGPVMTPTWPVKYIY